MMEAKPVLGNGLGVALLCNARPLPVLASRRDAWKALGLGPVQRNALGVALLCNAEGGGGPLRPLPV